MIGEYELFHAAYFYALMSVAKLHGRHAMGGTDRGVLKGIAELDRVAAAAARHRVVAGITDDEQVVSATTQQRVASGASNERVIAAIAFKELMVS